MKAKTKKFCATAFLLFALPFFVGANADASVSLLHSGKAEVTLTMDTSLSQEEFRLYLEEKVKGYNVVSGYRDAVTINNIQTIDEGYSVNVSLRRLDKVKLQGTILLDEFADFSIEGSEARKAIENAARGNIETVCGTYVDGGYGTLKVSRDTSVPLQPRTAEEEVLPVSDFLETAKGASSSSWMMFYRAFDVEHLRKITLSVPGKVTHLAGDGVRLLNASTLELTPVTIPVTVTKTFTYIDENGVEKTDTETVVKSEALGFAGYFVYSKSLSPVAITFICIGAAAVVGLLTAGLVYIYRLGKKEIAKGEAL